MSRLPVFLLVRLLVCTMGLLVGPACRTAPLLAVPPASEATVSTSPDADADAEVVALDPSDRAPITASPAWTGPEHPADGLYAHTSPGSLPELRDAQGRPLPLRHTDVHADLRGPMAEVRVRQTFHNAAKRPIEVVYSFPLPENSAVADMRMVIGKRVVTSEIEERQQARATYEQARAQGHMAALLEQERPNVFTHSVANIAPGEDVEVEIRYLQTLTYDAGQYELVFPMVVGPRFMPGSPTGGPPSGTGTHADTLEVPDAARISPPIVGHGTRGGDDISITVVADAGRPIVSWTTPTHEVTAEPRDGRLHVALAPKRTLPNRDFVLRYRVAGEQAQATAFIGPKDAHGNGHYLMVLVPPHVDVDAEVGRRELVFVVDRSGSMTGPPLALAKQTVRELLSHLRPVDTFDIVGFASGTERLFGQPRPANASNLILALRFIDGMHGGGGTMMADAVEASLTDEVEPGFNRYVLFLTDGYVGNEAAIFAGAEDLVTRIASRGQVARVFGIGIGASPNRDLLDGLAAAGRGVARTITTREEPAQVVNATMHDIDRPALTELGLPAGSPLGIESYPSTIPDLFVSQPVVVMGRYRGRLPTTLQLHALRGQTPTQVSVQLRHVAEDDETLATLWARAKVDELESRLWHGDDAEVVEQITTLGLRHRIVTAYTSFVAVDRSRIVGDGDPELIVQPTHAPEGVDVKRAGGAIMGTSSGGHTVSMEEFRNLPVGSAGRDFAQVVDQRASVSMDAARSPAPMPTRPVMYSMKQRIEHSSHSERSRSSATLQLVHVVLGRPHSDAPRSSRPLRASLRKTKDRLRRCFARSPAFVAEERTALLVELRVGASGELSVRLVHGTLGDTSAERCLVRALEQAPWALEPGTVLQLPLTMWAT